MRTKTLDSPSFCLKPQKKKQGNCGDNSYMEEKEGTYLQPIWPVPMADGGKAQAFGCLSWLLSTYFLAFLYL
jgi:hypothetical protein